MKKLILAAIAVTCAVSVYAQGTVAFDIRTAAGTSHVWGPSTINPNLSLRGNAPTGDRPAGTTDYLAAGMTLSVLARATVPRFLVSMELTSLKLASSR